MKQLLLLSMLLIISCICITAYACHKNNNTQNNSQEEMNKIEYKKTDSTDFELLPTMDSKSSAKNMVWVGTFQLVWNDLMDELINGPVEFKNYHSDIADNLNKKSFGVNDISESAYYKKWGLVSPKLKTQIEKGIAEKFHENSDILNSFNWTPAEKNYILYAMLKKNFEFTEKLNNLGKDTFHGSKNEVKYFGVNKNSKHAQKKSIGVLFYNNVNDYAVVLTSKQGDIVKLYRTNDEKTLSDYYNDMNKKTSKNIGYLLEEDQFKAPMMDFKSIREFEELCNKEIKNSDFIIGQAIETIQFKMDEAGVKIKSEAATIMSRGALPNKIRIQPRFFYFDDKFVIFISEEGKKPYFAMKVTDAEKLQK